MIVVDSNIIAYYWVNGPLTEIAQQVQAGDPEWHAPILWRSEMRSVLTGYLRDGSLDGAQIGRIMAAAEESFAGREHAVPSDRVFELAGETSLSAYDCEFVALASALGVPPGHRRQGGAEGVSGAGADNAAVCAGVRRINTQ